MEITGRNVERHAAPIIKVLLMMEPSLTLLMTEANH